MTPEIFTTRPPRFQDQFEAWRSWYQPVFDVIPKQLAGGAFAAAIRFWPLGGMAISLTTAPAVDIVRAKSHLRHEPVDHRIISYCARGAHSATTADASLEVPAGVRVAQRRLRL